MGAALQHNNLSQSSMQQSNAQSSQSSFLGAYGNNSSQSYQHSNSFQQNSAIGGNQRRNRGMPFPNSMHSMAHLRNQDSINNHLQHHHQNYNHFQRDAASPAARFNNNLQNRPIGQAMASDGAAAVQVGDQSFNENLERLRQLRAQMDAKVMPVQVQLQASALRPAINIQQNQQNRRYNNDNVGRGGPNQHAQNNPAVNRGGVNGVGHNAQQMINGENNPAAVESDTYRESQCVPGDDPDDINLGNDYIFIKDNASAIMRKGKRKVRYVFVEGAAEPSYPPPQQPSQQPELESRNYNNEIQDENDSRSPDGKLIKVNNRNQNAQQRGQAAASEHAIKSQSSQGNNQIGESGQSPENFQFAQSHISDSRNQSQEEKKQKQLGIIEKCAKEKKSKSEESNKSSEDRDGNDDGDNQQLELKQVKKTMKKRRSKQLKKSDIEKSQRMDSKSQNVNEGQGYQNLSIVDNNSMFCDSEGQANQDYKDPSSIFSNFSIQKNLNKVVKLNSQSEGSYFSFGSSKGASSFGNYSFHAESEKAKLKSQQEQDQQADIYPSEFQVSHNHQSQYNERRRNRNQRQQQNPDEEQKEHISSSSAQDKKILQHQKYIEYMNKQLQLALEKQHQQQQMSQQQDLRKSQGSMAKSDQVVVPLPKFTIPPNGRSGMPAANNQAPAPQGAPQNGSNQNSQFYRQSTLQNNPKQNSKEKLSLDLEYLERRRGSMVETLSDANKELRECIPQKQVMVRTPRRGRRKSIVILDSVKDQPRNFPIGRLNNYTKTLKRHKGPLSLASELESIDEIGDSMDKDDNMNFGEFEEESNNKNENMKVKKQAKSAEMNKEEDDQEKFAEVNSSMFLDSDQLSQSAKSDDANNVSYNDFFKQQKQPSSGLNNVKIQELEKIKQVQSTRSRAQSIQPSQIARMPPQLTPILNFGHGRRSNLVQKAEQIQRRAQRSRSIAMGELDQNIFAIRSQMLMQQDHASMKQFTAGAEEATEHQQKRNQHALSHQQLSQSQMAEIIFQSAPQHFTNLILQQLQKNHPQFSQSIEAALIEERKNYQAASSSISNMQQQVRQDSSPSCSVAAGELGAQQFLKPVFGLNKSKAQTALENIKNSSIAAGSSSSTPQLNQTLAASSNLSNHNSSSHYQHFSEAQAANYMQHYGRHQGDNNDFYQQLIISQKMHQQQQQAHQQQISAAIYARQQQQQQMMAEEEQKHLIMHHEQMKQHQMAAAGMMLVAPPGPPQSTSQSRSSSGTSSSNGSSKLNQQQIQQHHQQQEHQQYFMQHQHQQMSAPGAQQHAHAPSYDMYFSQGAAHAQMMASWAGMSNPLPGGGQYLQPPSSSYHKHYPHPHEHSIGHSNHDQKNPNNGLMVQQPSSASCDQNSHQPNQSKQAAPEETGTINVATSKSSTDQEEQSKIDGDKEKEKNTQTTNQIKIGPLSNSITIQDIKGKSEFQQQLPTPLQRSITQKQSQPVTSQQSMNASGSSLFNYKFGQDKSLSSNGSSSGGGAQVGNLNGEATLSEDDEENLSNYSSARAAMNEQNHFKLKDKDFDDDNAVLVDNSDKVVSTQQQERSKEHSDGRQQEIMGQDHLQQLCLGNHQNANEAISMNFHHQKYQDQRGGNKDSLIVGGQRGFPDASSMALFHHHQLQQSYHHQQSSHHSHNTLDSSHQYQQQHPHHHPHNNHVHRIPLHLQQQQQHVDQQLSQLKLNYQFSNDSQQNSNPITSQTTPTHQQMLYQPHHSMIQSAQMVGHNSHQSNKINQQSPADQQRPAGNHSHQHNHHHEHQMQMMQMMLAASNAAGQAAAYPHPHSPLTVAGPHPYLAASAFQSHQNHHVPTTAVKQQQFQQSLGMGMAAAASENHQNTQQVVHHDHYNNTHQNAQVALQQQELQRQLQQMQQQLQQQQNSLSKQNDVVAVGNQMNNQIKSEDGQDNQKSSQSSQKDHQHNDDLISSKKKKHMIDKKQEMLKMMQLLAKDGSNDDEDDEDTEQINNMFEVLKSHMAKNNRAGAKAADDSNNNQQQEPDKSVNQLTTPVRNDVDEGHPREVDDQNHSHNPTVAQFPQQPQLQDETSKPSHLSAANDAPITQTQQPPPQSRIEAAKEQHPDPQPSVAEPAKVSEAAAELMDQDSAEQQEGDHSKSQMNQNNQNEDEEENKRKASQQE